MLAKGLSMAVLALALTATGSLADPVRVVGVWNSPTNYVHPASCHPHCRPDQGDDETWQVAYPAAPHIRLENFRVRCNDNGTNACQFDSSTIDNDVIGHTATVHWRNRSDQVWLILQADEVQEP